MPSTALDLFTPVIPEAQFHPNFRAILHELYDPVRTVMQQWAEGFVDRDGKFVREFQTTFNSCFWELFLFALFRHLKWVIDFTHQAPDFLLSTPYGPLVVEAGVASHPQTGVPESDHASLLNEGEAPNESAMVDLASIRLANTIVTKHHKHLSNYSRLPHVSGRPFVIAVAPFEQPHAFANNMEAIFRVLYGFRKKLAANGQVVDLHETVLRKENGAEIPIGFFTNDRMAEVSAVIYSNTATVSKARALSTDSSVLLFGAIRYQRNSLRPRFEVNLKEHYAENLADGTYIFHNPYARKPVDPRAFFGREFNQYFFDELKQPVPQVSDGFLIQRFCMKLRVQGRLSPRKLAELKTQMIEAMAQQSRTDRSG